MQFQSRVTIQGIKKSKGALENGTPYDSTKIYVQTGLDDSKGNGKGFSTVEYNFGTSEEFDKMKHLSFPLVADCEMEIVTNGKTQKTIVKGFKAVAIVKAA